MKPRHSCPHCGAKIVTYRHGLNRVLVHALQVAWRESAQATMPFKVSDNEAFTFSERANFQKLKYWGLVDHATSSQGRPIEGFWRITVMGDAFVRGEAPAAKFVRTYRGDVAREETPAPQIHIAEVDPSWEIPRRIQYAQGARPRVDERQVTLF
jgi:hypothetical protein